MLDLFRQILGLTKPNAQNQKHVVPIGNDKNIGITTPNCPYCGIQLPKFPGSKTKCKNCAEYMYIRTRPSDQARIIIREDEIDKVEEQWAIATNTYDDYQLGKAKYNVEKNTLQKRFGVEPSKNDIMWGLYNKDRMEHAINNNWGLYRNTTFDMGDLLRKEQRLAEALNFYLDVLYVDMNGPMNNATYGKRFIPEEPHSFIAPGLVAYILKLSKSLNLSHDDLKKLFLRQASAIHMSLRTPISPDKALVLLEKRSSLFNPTPN